MPSLPAAYFERLYAADPDPWKIGRGWYEQRKRAILLSLLPKARYRLALEPGCGNGELTARLRERCDQVVAWDAADAAAAASRARFRDDPAVEIGTGALPGWWPTAAVADLVVLSEIGYYLDAADLGRVLDNGVASLRPGGTVIAAHWRWPAVDYPLSGDAVHDLLGSRTDLGRLGGYVDADVRVEVYLTGAGEPQSVARQVGLV